MLELYLGGARSGKSRLAEARAADSGLKKIYIATAQPDDAEMAARIAHHQRDREGAGWTVVEAPEQLAQAISLHASESACILVDCLTLWLSNWLIRGESELWDAVSRELLVALVAAPGRIILVSNEVGSGIVPMGELSRRFVDEAGRLHQEIAEKAQRVVMVTAGLEQVLKGQ
ncbi:MAG: bifunctional adenosylcobinamide kinase/adenosylcobinamide-phosphate guanylyltransferase [Spongiibacteraceae bacterium]